MSKKMDIDWAEIIDVLAHEYGWTIDYIVSLNLGQIIAQCKAIKSRYQRQSNAAQAADTNSPTTSSSGGNEEMPISDFVTKLGGKVNIREDGKKEIRV